MPKKTAERKVKESKEKELNFKSMSVYEMVSALQPEVVLTPRAISVLKELSIRNNLLRQLIKMNAFQAVKILIERVKVDINLWDDSLTPLMSAANHGYLDIFEYLLKNGANLNAITKDKETAFYYAVFKGRTDIVKFLLEGRRLGKFKFNINQKAKNDYTPLMLACGGGHLEIVEELVKEKDLEIDAINSQKNTALITTSVLSKKHNDNFFQIAKALINRGAIIFLKDNANYNALHFFACNYNYHGMLLLITHCKKLYREEPAKAEAALQKFVNENDNGYSALFCSASEGNLEGLRLLLSVGAEVNDANEHGVTPIMAAASNGHTKIVECLAKGVELKDREGAKKIIAADLERVNKFCATVITHLLVSVYKKNQSHHYIAMAKTIKLLFTLIQGVNNVDQVVTRAHLNSENKLLGAFGRVTHLYKQSHTSNLLLSFSLGSKKLIDVLLKKGASITTLIRKDFSVYRSAWKESYDFAFPILLQHKISVLCGDLFEKENREQIENSIQMISDFLCHDTISLKVLRNNTLTVVLAERVRMTIVDEDFPVIIQNLTQALSQKTSLSEEELVSLLKESVVNYKESRELEALQKIRDELSSLHRAILEAPSAEPDTEETGELISAADSIDEQELNAIQKPKRKRKGISNAAVIQAKMQEFTENISKWNQEGSLYTIYLPTQFSLENKAITQSKIETELQLLTQKSEKLEAQIQKTRILKTDAELRELEPKHRGSPTLSQTKAEKNSTIQKLKRETPSKIMNELPILPDLVSVKDKLVDLRNILLFDPKTAEEDALFLLHSGLWGGFAHLMEKLNKHHTIKVLFPKIAGILRNFIFHEEGELQKYSDPEAHFAPGKTITAALQDMCGKLLEFLDNWISHHSIRKIPKDLETFATEIDSKLFQELITLALKKARENENGIKQPSFEVCEQQLRLAENQVNKYKTIISRRPHLLENPNSASTIYLGLGRSIAAISTYSSRILKYYPEKFPRAKFKQYRSYITLGNLFRHDETHQSTHRNWRKLLHSLTQEFLIQTLIEQDSKPEILFSYQLSRRVSLSQPALVNAEKSELVTEQAAPITEEATAEQHESKHREESDKFKSSAGKKFS